MYLKKINLKKNKFLKKELLNPTKIYVKEILNLIKNNLINGCANISGGGLGENIKRVIPEGLTAEINLNKIKTKKIILDPVMFSKGGSKLISNKAIKILKTKLIKKASLITPNIPEAEVLTGYSISSKEDMIKAAKKILNMGSKNVLLKGGHLKSKMIFDILATKKGIKIFKKRKIRTKNTHGTGCTLSSALATCLSQRKNIVKSCKNTLYLAL